MALSIPQPLSATVKHQLHRYTDWLRAHRGLDFPHYEALWQWSVTDLEGFWSSLWDYFDIESETPYARVLRSPVMPGAEWFPGAQINLVRQMWRHGPAADAAGLPAVLHVDEAGLALGEVQELGWAELRSQVESVAQFLRAHGVQSGDRVCAVLPCTPHAQVAFLAAASIGAIWSLCSPDMGPVAILDRFRQIAPKVLLATDGYHWAGAAHDRRQAMATVREGLPSVSTLVWWDRLFPGERPGPWPPSEDSSRPTDRTDAEGAQTVSLWSEVLETVVPSGGVPPLPLPFDHPLWIVYSSGTTGLPKPIVHSQGGILLEMLKGLVLHLDMGPSVETGDRFHWYSSTGWVMWNLGICSLLAGTTVCTFDGSPSGPPLAGGKVPDWTVLWRFAGLTGATFFGAGAAFYASCLKAEVQPQAVADLRALRAIGSTGSPLSDECFDWIWEQLPRRGGQPIWITPISGGTDFAGAFVGGNITLPQVRGQMTSRFLGASVEAWSEAGEPLIDAVGELVCTRPMPSMPLRFWNDPGDQRYRESYFETYPATADRGPVWRHGDWIRLIPNRTAGADSAEFVSAIIYGRSDATINRHGVRMGTSELYRAVETLPEVLDSLVVDLEYLGRDSWMGLFVVLRDGVDLTEALQQRMRHNIRQALSPRHVPNAIYAVPGIPRTLTGKKMELPVKKLLMGAPPDSVMKRDAMANAECVDWFVALAAERRAALPGGRCTVRGLG